MILADTSQVVHEINVGNIVTQQAAFTALQGELIEAPVSSVPLPAALPLFGSAFATLAGLACRARRTVS